MKLLLTCVLAAVSPAVFSQQVINVDKSDGIPVNSFYTVNGSPVVSARFVRLTEGTPYFKDAWMKGLAISDKNLRYQNAQVKLDLFENELHYLGSNGTEMICTIPLKDLTLTDTVSGASYHFVHSTAVPALSPLRGGRPIQFDRFYAAQLGGKAVELLVQGYNNSIATLQWSLVLKKGEDEAFADSLPDHENILLAIIDRDGDLAAVRMTGLVIDSLNTTLASVNVGQGEPDKITRINHTK